MIGFVSLAQPDHRRADGAYAKNASSAYVSAG